VGCRDIGVKKRTIGFSNVAQKSESYKLSSDLGKRGEENLEGGMLA
jgi:hypothetical protein